MKERIDEVYRPMNEKLFNNLEKQYQELAKIKAESDQIEEITKDMCECCEEHFGYIGKCHTTPCDEASKLAESLYNAGYRKQSEGEWVLKGKFKSVFPLPLMNLDIECSACGYNPIKYSEDYTRYNYCPNCGAKMKGGAE